MVPAVIMKLDAIPLNQNQKVDRRKLPRPERTQGKAGKETGAAREMTALEQELMDVCASVIGNRDFGVETLLTEAGLQSISAMTLMVALEEKFGCTPDVNDLLRSMRVLDIENALVAGWRRGAAAGAEKTAAPAEAAIASAPLTQTQLGIYLECRMDETSNKYNIPFLLRLSRDTDPERLAGAIRRAVEAHPFMKCSVEPSKNSGADMIAHPDLSWEIPLETSDLPDAELESRLKQETTVFKLSRAPLFSFRLIRTGTSLWCPACSCSWRPCR